MARGECYLEDVDGTKLHLTQTVINGVLDTQAATHGGIIDWSRTMSKSPIIIPVPDQEPMGFDMNYIEGDTITINTTWFDGLGTGTTTTYGKAEQFFKKMNVSDTSSPYRLQLGEREYYVLLDRWTASGAGGHGDTIQTSVSLQIVEGE